MAKSPLSLLGSASSKEAILRLVDTCFRYRSDISSLVTEERAAEYGLDVPSFDGLVNALVAVVCAVLTNSALISSPEDALPALPADLDVRLKKLLCSIIVGRLPIWRDAAVRQRVSLPTLVDVDWRVDVKSSSAAISRIAVPTLLVNLKTRRQRSNSTAFPGEDTLSLELSRGWWLGLLFIAEL
jgi:hypothetical protein